MKRIQRKRTKGWRMPPNTVYVGRPTKWGNPFVIGTILYFPDPRALTRENVIEMYESWVRKKVNEDPTFLNPLKGKDLACFCPLDKPCHADVILKVLAEMEVQK